MSYDKWFQKFQKKPEFRTSIIKSIEKTGAPLEFRSGKKLTQLGYYCSPGFYIDKEKEEEINREIDLSARKKIMEIDTKYGLKILVNLKIIADCKFTPETDLLIFGLEDEIKPNTPVRFPIFTNGTVPIYKIIGNTIMIDECKRLFGIPEVSRRVVDVKQENDQLKKLERKNEVETNLFHFSEQVLSALTYYFNQYLIIIKRDYQNFYETYLRNIEEEKLKIMITPPPMVKVIDEIKKSFNVNLLKNEVLIVNIFIPMIIVGENTGLLRVIRGKSNNYTINDLEEIQWFMYLYAPSRPIKFSEILEMRYEQPIIVCNIKYLEECIKEMENGINELIKEMEKNLNRHQNRIVQEILKIIHPSV